jgi:hypothetical protein
MPTNSNSVEVLPYGNVGSTTLIQLNKYIRNTTVFPRKIVSQLVGHL